MSEELYKGWLHLLYFNAYLKGTVHINYAVIDQRLTCMAKKDQTLYDLYFSDSYSLHFYLTWRLLSTIFLLIFKIKIPKMKKVFYFCNVCNSYLKHFYSTNDVMGSFTSLYVLLLGVKQFELAPNILIILQAS